ncbi:MAG: NAD(P)H-dependent oxidoreductase [Planctomycetes bacterium]|nr:NAD(P)H-dependent oxidoreductase [Planctomycetota bacterium]
MNKILYIQASPREHRSKSIALADAFIESYRQSHPDDRIETLNLFETDLVEFGAQAVQAKYAILHGRQQTPEELAAWQEVQTVIDNFKSADKFVLAVPMWNFGIPYRLKQYIDVIVQPTLTFSYSPTDGYAGLVVGKSAFIAYARGGDYSSQQSQAFDFQKRYIESILAFIGFSDIRSIVVEPTLMAGPDIAAKKLAEAIGQAKRLGSEF